MEHAKDRHDGIVNFIDDDVPAGRHASQPAAQIVVTASPHVGMRGQKEKPIDDRIDQSIGSFNAAAFLGDVEPKFDRGRLRPRSQRSGPWIESRLPGFQAGEAALFYLFSKFSQGFLRDRASLAAAERRFRGIDGGQNFPALPLALFPQR